LVIDFECRIEGDVLRIKARGKDDSLQDVIDYGMGVLQEAISGDFSRVICDERELEYNLKIYETFESAKKMADSSPKNGKVAIVASRKNIEDARFWETVATNRGLNVRVFDDMREAERWIAK
jgi:hypothetical protein